MFRTEMFSTAARVIQGAFYITSKAVRSNAPWYICYKYLDRPICLAMIGIEWSAYIIWKVGLTMVEGRKKPNFSMGEFCFSSACRASPWYPRIMREIFSFMHSTDVQGRPKLKKWEDGSNSRQGKRGWESFKSQWNSIWWCRLFPWVCLNIFGSGYESGKFLFSSHWRRFDFYTQNADNFLPKRPETLVRLFPTVVFISEKNSLKKALVGMRRRHKAARSW